MDLVEKDDPIYAQIEDYRKSGYALYLSGKGYDDDTVSYTHLAQVEAELKAAMPKLKLHVTKEQRSGILPGRILAQSGIDIGEKLDPEKEYTLNVTVSEHMQYVIEGIIGLPYQEAVALIEEKTGVKPVLEQLDASDLSEEEKAKIKPGVVVEVDPKEGTAYTQDGDSVITIRFY